MIYAKDIIDRTCRGRTLVITYPVVNGIHPHYRIYLFKRTCTPQLNLRPYLLGDITDSLFGYAGAIVFFKEITDILHALASGIKAYYLV